MWRGSRATEEPLAGAEHSGSLTKKRWKVGRSKRFFVINNGHLTYYRNRKGALKGKSRGSMLLKDTVVMAERRHGIIVSCHMVVWHVRAKTEGKRDDWLKAINTARLRAQSQDDNDIAHIINATKPTHKLHTAIEAHCHEMITVCRLIDDQCTVIQRSLAEKKERSLLGRSKLAQSLSFSAQLDNLKTNCGHFSRACQQFLDQSKNLWKNEDQIRDENRYLHEQRQTLLGQIDVLARQLKRIEVAATKQQSGTQSNSEHDNCSDSEESASEESKSSAPSQSSLTACETISKSMREQAVQRPISLPRTPPVEQRTPHEPASVREHRLRPRQRRSSIPPKKKASYVLWTVLKNAIGRELSSIPMPVDFNEPLSFLQRMTENMEYSELLDRAATVSDPALQLCYVAAFVVSGWCNTVQRTGKPFNPLLGETFECDRQEDLDWRSIAEQVSHHPAMSALHVEGRGWKLDEEIGFTSKFRGQSIRLTPEGITHLVFHQCCRDNPHYSWCKSGIKTIIKGIILGPLWIHNEGEMDIKNHVTGDKCRIKMSEYSFLRSDNFRTVKATVEDGQGNVVYRLDGDWTKQINLVKLRVGPCTGRSLRQESIETQTIWTRRTALPGAEHFYNLTRLAVELNEPEEGVAPSDSRLRPDVRLMEQGDYERANREKVRLEEKQREATRRRTNDFKEATKQGSTTPAEYFPKWFRKTRDSVNGAVTHRFTDTYWNCKSRSDWSTCPDLF